MGGFNSKIDDIEKIFSGRAPGIMGCYNHYSVLVPLVEKDGELNLLFEVRSPDLERQPGEICFPGGKMEKGEDAEGCAVRETAEELGIGRSAIRVIGQLDSLHTYSNLTLYSFLGELNYSLLEHAKINHREVESVFYIPLADFITRKPFIYKTEISLEVGEDFPYEMINSSEGYNWGKGYHEVLIYKFGDKAIWGMTARIVYNLTEILCK